MKLQTIVLSAATVVALAAASYGAYLFGMTRGMAMSAGPGTDAVSIAAGEAATRRHIKQGIKAGDVDPDSGRRILFYHDPMVPGKKFDAPAKSPFMDMMLVPMYAGGDDDQGKVTVSPRIQQNLGVRTALVVSGSIAPKLEAVGTIAYNERDQVLVQARATGYVERLYVRATLDRVAAGQPLVDLYVPDWVAAQEEYLAVRRMRGTDLDGLIDGARLRMRQVGISEAQIDALERSGTIAPRVTITAPIGGVIDQLSVREGMTVMTGATLFRIVGLGSVWANAEVPESQAALVRPGATIEARSPAVPGAVFKGRVQTILPDVNATTRTIKARIELANPRGVLVPGMFVSVDFGSAAGQTMLLVPSEAIIQTGQRSVVMLAEDSGKFRPIDVAIGIEANGQTEIKR
ncbi:MAG: efflux RND transporter periplasmic adaptor subunit, partial [Burkholderiales bacterium]